MKQPTLFRLLSSAVLALLITLSSVPVLALSDLPQSSTVIVTELQTGLGTGQTDKEYIELYNATENVVDLSGWQLWYAPEARTAAEPYRLIEVADGITVEPGTHLLFTSEGYAPNQITPAQNFEKMLSAEGGNLILLAPAAAACQLGVQDALAWGGAVLGAGNPVASSPKTKDKLVARTVGHEGYLNTRNNLNDFASSSFSGSTSSAPYLGTPGILNTQPAPTTNAIPTTTGLDFTQPITDPNCEPTQEEPSQQPPLTTNPTTDPPATIVPAVDGSKSDAPVFPERNRGLASPHITELLPNPASPQTDAADEFIELYNSNDAIFELTGFKLVAGKRSYTFPSGTLIAPKSFAAYFSADTRLALSNSGGQVQLLDPFGNIIARSEPYSTAKDGQAWALANGAWHWTTSPTPKAANTIQAPTTSKKKSTASKTSATTQAVKGSSTAAEPDQTAAERTAGLAPSTPIHPAMLALVGVFAILYGMYEYRGDLANKFYQFRTYRAARRSLGRTSAGRRGN